MIVVDASLLIEVLVGDEMGEVVGARLAGRAGALVAPEVLDLEIIQTLRRLVRCGRVSAATALQGFEVLEDLRIERFSHAPLLERIWSLRDNLTAYDAAYFALAEMLDAPLWTRDGKYADIAGSSAIVETL